MRDKVIWKYECEIQYKDKIMNRHNLQQIKKEEFKYLVKYRLNIT